MIIKTKMKYTWYKRVTIDLLIIKKMKNISIFLKSYEKSSK